MRHNHPVERIARPRFKRSRLRHIGKRVIAHPQAPSAPAVASQYPARPVRLRPISWRNVSSRLTIGEISKSCPIQRVDAGALIRSSRFSQSQNSTCVSRYAIKSQTSPSPTRLPSPPPVPCRPVPDRHRHPASAAPPADPVSSLRSLRVPPETPLPYRRTEPVRPFMASSASRKRSCRNFVIVTCTIPSYHETYISVQLMAYI